MGIRSNKQLAEILSSSKEEDLELDIKITLATEEILLQPNTASYFERYEQQPTACNGRQFRK